MIFALFISYTTTTIDTATTPEINKILKSAMSGRANGHWKPKLLSKQCMLNIATVVDCDLHVYFLGTCSINHNLIEAQYVIEALRQQTKYKNRVQKAQNILVGWSNFGVVHPPYTQCVCSGIMFSVESALKAHSVGYFAKKETTLDQVDLSNTKNASIHIVQSVHCQHGWGYTHVPAVEAASTAAEAVRSRSRWRNTFFQ